MDDLWGDEQQFAQRVYDEYLDAVNSAYEILRTERRAQLKPGGSYSNGFNAAGYHELSHAWGRITQCERLLPDLIHLEAKLGAIRAEAVRDAEENALMATRLGLVLDGAAA